MSYLFLTLLGLTIAALAVLAFINTPPRVLAGSIHRIGPLILLVIGTILFISGRAGVSAPFFLLALAWWQRTRGVSRIPGSTGGGRKSTVRSAWLEMELDHETGDLDGYVLTGTLEGAILSELPEPRLLELYEELLPDAESAALMEAYLDRRIAGWRESTDYGADSRAGDTPGTGPMTKEEAYQVLGLDPGADADEVRNAHRRLMKRVHPDQGGSTFLAARINEAKEILLR